MKILYLIHQYIPDAIGGTELLLHDLAESIQADGNDVAIFAYHESMDPNPASFGTRIEMVDGIRVYRFHFNLSIHPNIHTGEFRNAFAEQALNEVIEDFSPNVAHVVHAMKLGGGIFEILSNTKIPIVTTLSDYWYFCLRHNLLLPDQSPCTKGPIPGSRCLTCLQENLSQAQAKESDAVKALKQRNPYLKEALLCSHSILALSAHQRETYVRFGFPAERIQCAEHGVDTGLLAPAREQHSKQTERESEAPIKILFVGTLLPHKGAHLLVHAVLQSPEAQVEVRIIGNQGHGGSYAADLVTASAEDSRIIFAGECDHASLHKEYEWCDLLAMPSIWDENEPIVVKEARWCGIPVATHDLPGMGDLVHDGEDGWIIADPSIESWKDWLAQLEQHTNRYLPPKIELPTNPSFASTMLECYTKAVEAGSAALKNSDVLAEIE